jgi:peptidoglycan/LPS O-acetylase OafA/YrhL
MEKIKIDVLNGFTFIRIVAAILVLVTHSYVILGLQGDPFERMGVIAFSKLGVDAFFVISGYLVTLSLCRNNNLLDFAKNRAIRILPGLAVAVLVSVFFGGSACFK